MTHTRRALTACAAGATLALGAPPLRWWPTTFLAAALFALAIDGASTRRAALSGWLMGTVATLGAFHWIVGTVTRFTDLPLPAALLAYVLLAMLAGLTHAVAGALAGAAGPALGYPVALGLGMLAAERYVPGIFPWQFAAPLIYAPWVRQAADVVGLSGLSALLAATMMVLARQVGAWRARRRGEDPPPGLRRQVAVALAVLVALWAYGGARTVMVQRAMASAPRTQVALVQPSIPPTVRWDELEHGAILQNLQRQTQAAVDARVDLVVWSEAAYPFMLPHTPGRDGEWGPPIVSNPTPVPMLVGAVTRDAQGRRYNAAFIREPDGTLSAPVAKRVLVAFGEYIPVLGEIEWVRRTFARADGLSAGQKPTMLVTRSGLKLGVLNCFEDTIARLGAELSNADMLVNITNDAWFGDGAAPWQHLMLAQWRTIETRRELVRAVNTGVTTRVDALGRIVEHAPLWRPVVLVADVRRLALRPLAPYTIRYAPPIAVLILAVAVAVRLRRRYARARA
jgi:apolipoprotein N-acyltransferase